VIEIRVKRGTATYLAEQNPVLDIGEPCLELDTGKIKYGDGVTPWNLLAYASGGDTSGTNNEITGTDGFVGGGSDNTVSGANGAIVGGTTSDVTGAAAVILGGQSNTASGAKAVVLGGNANTAAKANAVVVGGANNLADGIGAIVLGGSGNSAEATNSVVIGKDGVADKEGQIVLSGGKFKTAGDAQTAIYQLRQETDDAVATRMFLNGVTGELVVPPNSLWHFDIKCVAYDKTLDAAAVWSIRGGIMRDYNEQTKFVGPPTVESWGDDWDSAATIDVTASNTTNALTLTVTGIGGHEIQWYATVITTETTTEEPLNSDMFVDIVFGDPVTSLSVTVTEASGQSIFPAFSPTITDYVINAGTYFSDTSPRNYSVTINGGTPITGTTTTNKCLRIKAPGNSYFVRLIPNDLPLGNVSLKTAQYTPGYYLVVPSQGSPAYVMVYDGNGVPVFYTPGHGGIFSVAPGWENNRLTTNGHTGNYDRWDMLIGLNTLTALPYDMINPDTRGGSHTWEIHESQTIRTPGRVGNIIYQSYDSTGFYIQEQNPQNQIVWEWWSDDYFNTGYADFFHINSIDVHPVTGDIVVSCRHPSSVFCIDYQTKNILWATSGDGFHSSAIQPAAKPNMTTTTKWLTTVGEPTLAGYTQYNATSAQHDARWVDMFIPPLTPGNSVVSISDNQSLTYRPARGVIFEINMTTNQAIFRSHVYSTRGSTPWQGSFNVVKELSGLTSHFANFPTQHPNLVEYLGDAAGVGSQTKTLEMDIAGDMYRAVKVRSDFLNINYMRTTAGRTVTVL